MTSSSPPSPSTAATTGRCPRRRGPGKRVHVATTDVLGAVAPHDDWLTFKESALDDCVRVEVEDTKQGVQAGTSVLLPCLVASVEKIAGGRFLPDRTEDDQRREEITGRLHAGPGDDSWYAGPSPLSDIIGWSSFNDLVVSNPDQPRSTRVASAATVSPDDHRLALFISNAPDDIRWLLSQLDATTTGHQNDVDRSETGQSRRRTIADRLRAAAPGDQIWRADFPPAGPRTPSIVVDPHRSGLDTIALLSVRRLDPARENGEFIAHAPDDIRWLLSRLEQREAPTGSGAAGDDPRRELGAVAPQDDRLWFRESALPDCVRVEVEDAEQDVQAATAVLLADLVAAVEEITGRRFLPDRTEDEQRRVEIIDRVRAGPRDDTWHVEFAHRGEFDVRTDRERPSGTMVAVPSTPTIAIFIAHAPDDIRWLLSQLDATTSGDQGDGDPSDGGQSRRHAIADRLRAAAPGDQVWHSYYPTAGHGHPSIAVAPRGRFPTTITGLHNGPSVDPRWYGEFIAHAPDDIRWLLTQLEQRDAEAIARPGTQG